MEDREKVKDIIKKLNQGEDGEPWDEATGFYTLPQLQYDKQTGQFAIMMSNGVTVKLFVNTKTGELKVYWADKLTQGKAN